MCFAWLPFTSNRQYLLLVVTPNAVRGHSSVHVSSLELFKVCNKPALNMWRTLVSVITYCFPSETAIIADWSCCDVNSTDMWRQIGHSFWRILRRHPPLCWIGSVWLTPRWHLGAERSVGNIGQLQLLYQYHISYQVQYNSFFCIFVLTLGQHTISYYDLVLRFVHLPNPRKVAVKQRCQLWDSFYGHGWGRLSTLGVCCCRMFVVVVIYAAGSRKLPPC